MDRNEIVLFETVDNEVKLDVLIEDEMVWLNQAQMTELFDVDRTVITRHINNVFKEKELEKITKKTEFFKLFKTSRMSRM